MKRNVKVVPSVDAFSVLFILLCTGALAWAQWTNAAIDTITNTQVRKETMAQSLCIDDSGMVHLVWKQQRTGGWRIFYRTNSPSGTWGAIQEVGDSSQAAFDPAMAWWSATSIPFVVFEQDLEIYAALLYGSVWQAEPITANAQLDCSPTIAIDGTAIPHVAWITDDSISGQYKIAYAMGYLVGPYIHWETQTLAGSDLGPYGTGAAPFIAVTAQGVAHIVYRGGDYGNYHIHHAWNTAAGDTNWSYEILYSGNANDFSASMFIENEGNFHLAVSGNDGWGFPGRVFYFFKPFGQPWQQYELASSAASAVQPSLSVDANGTPHVVWMETSGNFYTGNIYYSAKDTAGVWTNSLVIGNDHFTPSFAVDQLGYGHVACHTGGNTSIFDIYHVKSSEVLTYLEESKDTRVGAGPGVTLGLSPNPVQDYTYISYNTTVPDNVVLTAYNSLGAEVARLVDEHRTPGINRIVWYPYGLSAGVYFLRLRSGGSEQVVKCVLLPR